MFSPAEIQITLNLMYDVKRKFTQDQLDELRNNNHSELWDDAWMGAAEAYQDAPFGFQEAVARQANSETRELEVPHFLSVMDVNFSDGVGVIIDSFKRVGLRTD